MEEIDKAPFGVGTALRPYHLAEKDYFASLPTCGKGGPQAQAPEYEAILANTPNVIISFFSADVNDEIASRTNVPVIGLTQGKEGIFDAATLKSLEAIAKVFNKTKRYDELVSYINSAKNDFSSLSNTTETYYAGCIGNWGKTNLFGSFKNFPVFDYAHATNVVDSLSDLANNKQMTIDPEKLTELNPDKIFVDGAGFKGFIDDYKANKGKYEGLSAIKNGEVYALLPYNAYYTNLEIQLISTYYVASVAHPESFKNFDIKAKANEVTKKLLGKELYDQMCEYDTSLGGYQKLDINSL